MPLCPFVLPARPLAVYLGSCSGRAAVRRCSATTSDRSSRVFASARRDTRRAEWNALRKLDPAAAKRFKGARWVLLKE